MAAWKTKLLASLQVNSSLPYAKYVQLATVRLDGRPANRTVVFRGFLKEGQDLTFVTDARSHKVAEAAVNPAAELCWYFPSSREQYRISGSLTVVGPDHASSDLLGARQAGQPRDPDPQAFSGPVPGPGEAPLPTFCLIVMKVTEVDYVQLFDNLRCRFSLLDNWVQQDVNP